MHIQELVARCIVLVEWRSFITTYKFFILWWWYLRETFKIKKIVKKLGYFWYRTVITKLLFEHKHCVNGLTEKENFMFHDFTASN